MKILHPGSCLVLGALVGTVATAAGYEKNIPFSGRYAGIAGASASSVAGPESLLFNPAGLGGAAGWQFNLNFSPTFAKFSGPVIKDGDTKQGERLMLPILGVAASYGINEKWTAGLSFGSIGGSQAKFTNIDPRDVDTGFPTGNAQTVKTDLKIYELGLGAGYKLNSNWSFGASWRLTFVQAAFSTFSPHPLVDGAPGNSASWLNLYDLSDKQMLGFRLGAQYRADDNKWGLGVALRTHIGFSADGKAAGNVTADNGAGGQAIPIAEVDATVKSNFPLQLQLGGDFALAEKWRLFTEYVWTQYSKNKSVELAGTITVGVTPVNLAGNSLHQNWFDQHHIKLGTEYTGIENWPLRFGYIFTTQVVPKSTALASFPAPGLGHNFTFGTSHNIGPVAVSAAFEYGVESATVASGEGVQGDYKVDGIVVHLGADYKF